MRLTPGTHLGSYETRALIGKGGMGEVYRAFDTRLKREVAIKILPDAFAHDAERLARFQREAELLASLNHPNIAAIYGLEVGETQAAVGSDVSRTVRALVLELVEGPTLADRVATGRVTLDEALPIAAQIAAALEAAHDKGVVHRDLKPANIKVTPEGRVKVLDFGLAKAFEASSRETGRGEYSQMATITSPAVMTSAGAILGTAAYMAPEQARGKPADRRSDIWAFGCVLFEILSGARAFPGEEITDTLAFVITRDPDWAALPTDTPAGVRRLLRRCLQKDRVRRLADIADARLEIEESQTDASAPEPAGTTANLRAGSTSRASRWLAWSLAIVSTLAAISLAGVIAFTPEPEGRTLRFSVSLPAGWATAVGVSTTGAAIAPMAVSPDGRYLVLLARNAEGRDGLWLRALDTLEMRELPETSGAAGPFWSPDSRSVAFFAGGKLKKIDVAGGRPLTLCDSAEFRGGTWNRDGVIVFSSTAQAALSKVSASGGIPTPATVLAPGEANHLRPTFLPDGRHFVYRVQNGGIYLASLDSPDRRLLFENPDGSNVVFTDGQVLFLRETTLMAQPFDSDTLTLSGEPVPIAERIQTIATPPVGIFSASNSGVLAYLTGSPSVGSNLTWFDRSGKPLGVVGDRAPYGDLALSPDGKRAAVSIIDPVQRTRDIWLVDLARGLRTRFTFDRAEERGAIWSPDGGSIVFSSLRQGPSDLYQKPTSGGGVEAAFLVDKSNKVAWSWSPDGRVLFYGVTDIWALPTSGDRKPTPFLQTPSTELQAEASPDGKWVAYVSNDSGPNQVYVAPFPGPGGMAQVSASGGVWPRWRGDGREIFYLSPDARLMVAAVDGRAEGFQVGEVRPLFPPRLGGVRSNYDVTSDGQRFLVITQVDEAASAPLTVVVNWQAARGARER